MSEQQPPAYTSYPTAGRHPHYGALPPPSKTRAGWALGLALVPAALTWIVSLVLAIQVIRDATATCRAP